MKSPVFQFPLLRRSGPPPSSLALLRICAQEGSQGSRTGNLRYLKDPDVTLVRTDWKAQYQNRHHSFRDFPLHCTTLLPSLQQSQTRSHVLTS
jgi:hypothetical protein